MQEEKIVHLKSAMEEAPEEPNSEGDGGHGLDADFRVRGSQKREG
jgi:hypothetical protein